MQHSLTEFYRGILCLSETFHLIISNDIFILQHFKFHDHFEN
jgi:hypothetical protein